MTTAQISQDFQVKFVKIDEQGSTVVAPELSNVISGWEREFDEDEDNGFLVTGNENDDQDDDGDDDGDDGDAETSGTLHLWLTANAQALAEFKAITEDTENDYEVHVIYGNGALTKVFEINPDGWIVLNSGTKNEASAERALEIEMLFDVYDVDTKY